MHPRIRHIEVVDATTGEPDRVIQVIARVPEAELPQVGPLDRNSLYIAADGEPLVVDSDGYVGEKTGRRLRCQG